MCETTFKFVYILNFRVEILEGFTYDFSTHYTTSPHNLIKDKLIDFIERTFQREGSLSLHVMTEMHFLLPKNLKIIMHGHVKIYVMR